MTALQWIYLVAIGPPGDPTTVDRSSKCLPTKNASRHTRVVEVGRGWPLLTQGPIATHDMEPNNCVSCVIGEPKWGGLTVR